MKSQRQWGLDLVGFTQRKKKIFSMLIAFITAVACFAPVIGHTTTAYADQSVNTSTETDSYPNGIKGEYNPLGINAGVGISTNDITGEAEKTVLKNFNQFTVENDLKPEYWYDSNHNFRMSDNAKKMLTFASKNHLVVYGHVLAWYSQTPDWFFQADENCQDTDGSPDNGSTTCPLASKEVLLQRQQTFIKNVAEAISNYVGPFGSSTNPVKAYDVVNESISDSESPETNGMRNSLWYQITGEEYIDDSFTWANEYMNNTYAEKGSSHPVKLFINDYGDDGAAKRSRYVALIQRMVDRKVPFDGIGHQTHVSLSTNTDDIKAAIDAMRKFGKKQAITELDVGTGTPVTPQKLVEQGRFYYRVNQIIHEEKDQLFSVTVWDLTDATSWRASDGSPCLFNADLSIKPAYIGYIGDEGNLPADIKSTTAFKADTNLDSALPSDKTTPGSGSPWDRLPHTSFAKTTGAVTGEFLPYWNDGKMTVYVSIKDATNTGNDKLVVTTDSGRYDIARSTGKVSTQTGASTQVVTARVVNQKDGSGYQAVIQVPISASDMSRSYTDFNIQGVDGTTGTVNGWNAENVMGNISPLQQTLGYVEAMQLSQKTAAPQVDANPSAAVWSSITPVSLDEVTDGSPLATGTAKVMWKDDTLYVLVNVVDPYIDTSASSPWEQDSVEVYIDRGNTKSASYSDSTQQIRVSADGLVSYGSGASTEIQQSLVKTAATRTKNGYAVEMAIDLGKARAGNYEGVDFQINDAKGGSRIGIRNWANPTGDGYATPAHWGVLRLVESASRDTGGDGSDANSADAGKNTAGRGEAAGNQASKPSEAAGNQASKPSEPVRVLAKTGVDMTPLIAAVVVMAALGSALLTLRLRSVHMR
ncbi:endo-1,4-beta-xylanase [Bifidobacterium animalis]|uniref:endo-1,4-beta-xylanase n=1 Tax=Bifidobacterium animalis TaxID=28025 RepID=UPI001BD15EA6|nr:endo-1,4-beta-xylanase [Bifidobacterium animalis]